MIGISVIMGASRKRKRLTSPTDTYRNKLLGSNNPSISSNRFNKEGYNWLLYNKIHKCIKCGSKDYGLSKSKLKGKKMSSQLIRSMEVIVKEVEVVEVASLANRNYFYQFIHTFPWFFALFRPNIFIKFRLANIFKALLSNSLSLLKLSAWANLLI